MDSSASGERWAGRKLDDRKLSRNTRKGGCREWSEQYKKKTKDGFSVEEQFHVLLKRARKDAGIE